MSEPMLDLCRCEHTREAHKEDVCTAYRPSRGMWCSCSAFVSRDHSHREWVVAHPAEALATLEKAGVLAKRWMVPESRYLVAQGVEDVRWTVVDDPDDGEVVIWREEATDG